MSTWPSNGIHHDVPFSVYRSDDITAADTWETAQGKATSKSTIIDFAKDPGAWKRTPKKAQTAAMGFGSLVDTLLLDEDKFESRYTVSPYPDFRTKAAQEWRDEMTAAGVQIVTEDKMSDAWECINAIRQHQDAVKLLCGARTQVAFRHDTKWGIASKGLIDIIPANDDCLVDLKTCEHSALDDKHAIQRHMLKWGHHIQAGAYLEGYNIASCEELSRFKFIFVTSAPPYKCAVIELPLCAILFGADLYRSGVERLADCLERNVWPSQWDGTVEVDLPEYAYI